MYIAMNGKIGQFFFYRMRKRYVIGMHRLNCKRLFFNGKFYRCIYFMLQKYQIIDENINKYDTK